MPEVSIVIPTHNRSAFISDAVESALRQTYRDREVIVVDDGSTDDTLGRLSRFGDRIRIVRKEQGGSASARNLGIREARGTWIAFLDSDDIWIDMKTEVQMGFAGRHPEFPWLAASYWKLEGGREFLRTRAGRSGNLFRQTWEKNFVRTSTVMVRKECFQKVGPFREELPINQDLDLWLRLARQFPLGYLSEPLALYRHHPGGKSRDVLRSRKIYLDLIRTYDDPEVIPRWASRRRRAYLQASVGKHQVAAGEVAQGRQALWKAARTWPPGWKAWRLLLKSFLPRKPRQPEQKMPIGRPRRSPLKLKVRRGDPERLRRIVDEYQRTLEEGGGTILREGHKGRVIRLGGAEEEVIVKYYRQVGLLDSIRSLLGGSRASRAMGQGDSLGKSGLRVPPIIGVADRWWRRLPFDSLLVMEPIPDALEMDRKICRLAPDGGGKGGLREMARSFAASLRKMYESGFYHCDLKSCNVLVRPGEGSWEFVFLDLEDIRQLGQVPLRLRLENLAQINATVPSWIGLGDRLRFLLAVLGRKRLDGEAKDLFRKVLARSREKDRVFYDDEGVVRETWPLDGAGKRSGETAPAD